MAIGDRAREEEGVRAQLVSQGVHVHNQHGYMRAEKGWHWDNRGTQALLANTAAPG